MKIQKGIVKYKDRNDIVCTYGITDDGKQYYFLGDTSDKKFSNGNRIASTLLVEAIDPMVKASNVGVISEDGNIVVPFDNKSIRLVNDSIIVVEKAEPVTQSVKDAIEMRNDPLSATKLVSTPAAIKDKLYAKMGTDSRFVFNDQFSEATVCDINGNNLVNGEYYSFIAVANNKLYFSKNTIDSPISEYSLLPPEVQSDVTPTNDGTEIDVNNVSVDSNTVEDAMKEATDNNSKIEEDLNVVKDLGESVPEVPMVDVPKDSNISLPQVVEDAEEEDFKPYNEALSKVEDITPEENVKGEVQPIAPAEEKDEEFKPYNDSLSKIVDTTTATEEENSEKQKEDSSLDIVEDAKDEEKVDEDSSTKSINDLTSTEENKNEEKVEETSDIEEKKEDSSVDTVEKTSIDEKVEEVANAAENSLIEPVNEDSPIEENEDAKESIESQLDEETIDEVKFNDNVSEDADSLESAPPVDNLPEPEEVKVDNTVPPVVEDDTNVEDGEVGGISKEAKLDKDISTVVDEISGDIKEDYDIDSILKSSDEKDIFTNTIKPDKIDTSLDDFDAFTSEFKTGSSDTIMTDIAKSMTELMKQNREQRTLIAEYQEKFDVINTQKKVIVDKYKDQAQKLEALASKCRSLENAASRLETRNQLLESKISEQERLINSQERELGSLRPQLQGKEDLVKILADAKALLGDDGSYM